jgi:hypothetical protein
MAKLNKKTIQFFNLKDQTGLKVFLRVVWQNILVTLKHLISALYKG